LPQGDLLAIFVRQREQRCELTFGDCHGDP
jgi:hypothetical protein